MSRTPRWFLALALTTASLTFMLVILGATVRVTGSGMGCPDWPLCYGQWLPPWNLAAILEWVHRLVAALVSSFTLFLLGAIAVVGPLRSRFGGHALLLALFLACQIGLGAYTVAVSNGPLSVALHLIMGYMFLGALLSIVRRAVPSGVEAEPVPPVLRLLAAASLVAVTGQAFIGALVSSSYAGRACPDFPTCFGQWLPPLVGNIGLQMSHRYGALVLSLVLLTLVFSAEFKAPARLLVWTRVAAFVLGVQITIGMGAVLLPVSLVVNVLHQLGAVSLFCVSWWALHTALAKRPSAASVPAPKASALSAAEG